MSKYLIVYTNRDISFIKSFNDFNFGLNDIFKSEKYDTLEVNNIKNIPLNKDFRYCFVYKINRNGSITNYSIEI